MVRNRIDVVTVCVNYADYLRYTIGNSKLFNSYRVATVAEDTETIELCKKHNVQYVISDRMIEGGKFWKGRGINDALDTIEDKQWILHVDADTLLLPNIKNYLDDTPLCPACIYGLKGRYKILNVAELKEFVEQKKVVTVEELENVDMLAGFFQLWHGRLRKHYPEENDSAAMDDIIMRNGFKPESRKILDLFCLHLGPAWVNHYGRKSKKFE